MDHFSWSAAGRSAKKRKLGSVNRQTEVLEALSHNHLDDLVEAPALWKVAVDSAFRRIPLRPEHGRASWVAFMVAGCVYVSQHFACPFGACSSVHAWERAGALLTTIARKLLRLPIFRYVDDVFCTDRCGAICTLGAASIHVRCRPESVEHALQCMVRLIKALLGIDAVASHKAEFGLHLTVLGVELAPGSEGFTCRMSRRKALKCRGMIAMHARRAGSPWPRLRVLQ